MLLFLDGVAKLVSRLLQQGVKEFCCFVWVKHVRVQVVHLEDLVAGEPIVFVAQGGGGAVGANLKETASKLQVLVFAFCLGLVVGVYKGSFLLISQGFVGLQKTNYKIKTIETTIPKNKCNNNFRTLVMPLNPMPLKWQNTWQPFQDFCQEDWRST